MKKTLSCLVLFLCMVHSIFAIGQINIASLPYTISTPGSYILVKDLKAASNQVAISILTSNVFLDMNGHNLYGAGTTSGTSGIGISGDSTRHNITITNGRIQDFRDNGIVLLGNNIVLTHLNIYRNRNYGIYIGTNGRIENCYTYGNGSSGIVARFADTIKDNNIAYSYIGLSVSTGCYISGNYFYQNRIGLKIPGSGNILEHNTFTQNTSALLLDSSSNSNFYGNNKMYSNPTTITNNGTNNHDGTTIDAAWGNLNL